MVLTVAWQKNCQIATRSGEMLPPCRYVKLSLVAARKEKAT